MAKVDHDPNEWIKMPEGLCDKIVGGSTTAASETGNNNPPDDGHENHDH